METSERFIGLTKRQSYTLAERLNLIPHLVRMDERQLFGYPEDTRDDRVCLEFDERKVSRATIQ